MSKPQKVLLLFVFSLFFYAGFSIVKSQQVSAQCVPILSQPRALNGLITTQNQQVSGVNPSLFGNNTGNCVNSSQAALPAFALPTYAQLKSIYYDQFNQSKVAGVLCPVQGSPSITKNNSYPGTAWEGFFNDNNNPGSTYGTPWLANNCSIDNVQQDFYINFGVNSNVNGVAVVFVDGNLIIGNAASPVDLYFHPTDDNGGIVFVVQGDVQIDKRVKEVDAVIISFGTICTAYEGTYPNGNCPQPPLGYSDPQTTSPLVVNGSLIALNPQKPIIFRRKLINNRIAAESVTQKPRYNVLLKNIFSQTLTLTTENTNFADNGPPPISYSCQPSKTSAYVGDPISWTTTNPSGGTGSPYTFSWSGDQGFSSTLQNPNPISYNAQGTYGATLQVTDASGSQASKSCGTVNVTIPPIGDTCSVSTNPATSPVAGNTNTTTFTWTAGNATGGQGGPYTYSWSGTGGLTAGNVQTVNQTYSSAGTQSATLTVKDKNNNPQNINCSNTAQVYSPASLTCGPNPTSATTSTPVTWTANPANGSGTFNYAWGSSDGLVSGSSQSSNPVTYSTTGAKSAYVSMVDVATGQAISNHTCETQVTVATTASVTCSSNITQANPGQNATWTATPSGGSGSYGNYSWSGTETLTGASLTVSKAYTSTGTKTANFSMSDLGTGQNISGQACTNSVAVANATLTGPTGIIHQNTSVTVSWTNDYNPQPGDYISLFTSTGADTAPIKKIYLNSCTTTQGAGAPAVSGSCSYLIPAGQATNSYNFRLFNNFNGIALKTATCSTFTVFNP